MEFKSKNGTVSRNLKSCTLDGNGDAEPLGNVGGICEDEEAEFTSVGPPKCPQGIIHSTDIQMESPSCKANKNLTIALSQNRETSKKRRRSMEDIVPVPKGYKSEEIPVNVNAMSVADDMIDGVNLLREQQKKSLLRSTEKKKKKLEGNPTENVQRQNTSEIPIPKFEVLLDEEEQIPEITYPNNVKLDEMKIIKIDTQLKKMFCTFRRRNCPNGVTLCPGEKKMLKILEEYREDKVNEVNGLSREDDNFYSLVGVLKEESLTAIECKYIGGGTFGEVFQLYHDPRFAKRRYSILKKIERRKLNLMEPLAMEEMGQDPEYKQFYPELLGLLFLEESAFLQMEYTGKTLTHFVKDTIPPIPTSKLDDLAAQILGGIGGFIRHGFVHRDLKWDNITVLGNCVKIIDFGAMLRLKETQLLPLVEPYTWGMTLPLAPPEIWHDPYHPHENSDIWALGPIVFFMCTGDLLWRRMFDKFRITEQQRKMEFVKTLLMGSKTELVNALHACVRETPEARWPPDREYWMEYIQTCLSEDPATRSDIFSWVQQKQHAAKAMATGAQSSFSEREHPASTMKNKETKTLGQTRNRLMMVDDKKAVQGQQGRYWPIAERCKKDQSVTMSPASQYPLNLPRKTKAVDEGQGQRSTWDNQRSRLGWEIGARAQDKQPEQHVALWKKRPDRTSDQPIAGMCGQCKNQPNAAHLATSSQLVTPAQAEATAVYQRRVKLQVSHQPSSTAVRGPGTATQQEVVKQAKALDGEAAARMEVNHGRTTPQNKEQSQNSRKTNKEERWTRNPAQNIADQHAELQGKDAAHSAKTSGYCTGPQMNPFPKRT